MRRALLVLAVLAVRGTFAATDLGQIALLDDVIAATNGLGGASGPSAKVLGLRTGLEGEYGSGWGYKVYDFASDRRGWELNVPGLVASVPKRTNVFSCTYTNTHSGATHSGYAYTSPVSSSDGFLFGVELVETKDAYSTNACAQAAWWVWAFPAVSNQSDLCAISLSATNRVETGVLYAGEFAEEHASSVSPSTLIYTYGSMVYSATAVHYMSNFRITGISGSGATRQVAIAYDVLARSSYNAGGYVYAYVATDTLTLTSGLTVDATVEKPASLIITDKTQHFVYDGGLKCTWEIACTNGVFYTRKVSDRDYRKNEFAD